MFLCHSFPETLENEKCCFGVQSSIYGKNMCCQMIRNGHDSDWSGCRGRGGQILCINVPGLFTLDIMLPTLCLKMTVFSKKAWLKKIHIEKRWIKCSETRQQFSYYICTLGLQ